MKKTFLVMTAACLLPLLAQAQDPAQQAGAMPPHQPGMQGGPGGRPPESLEEARKHAHEHAAELDKMTPAEWKEREERRKAFFAKVDKMTPQERDAYFKERREKWEHMTPAQREEMKAKHKAEHGGGEQGGAEVPGGHE